MKYYTGALWKAINSGDRELRARAEKERREIEKEIN